MTQRRIYQEEYPYFVTTNTYNRRSFFDDERYAQLLYEVIVKSCRIKNFLVYAFCIMPNHLHLLAGNDPTQPQRVALGLDCGFDIPIPNAGRCARVDTKFDISQVMHAIKSYYCKAMRMQYGVNNPIWQTRFNTRIIDTEERLRHIIEYIKNNSEKADLPSKYHKFPYQYFNEKLIKNLF